jgi:hypothetical protein
MDTTASLCTTVASLGTLLAVFVLVFGTLISAQPANFLTHLQKFCCYVRMSLKQPGCLQTYI